jgi:putative tryptophan/tyrosine transport system substrate-binding protein
MGEKIFLWLLATILLGTFSAQAQQPKKIPRVGYLSVDSSSSESARAEALRGGLRELGYVEGKNIVIEWRFADAKPDRLAALAAELVSLKVDVIITGGTGSTRAANEATSTIPIVMTQDLDPVRNGFVASLAQPGGNITGLSNFGSDLSGKRLELLKETIPKLSRVAALGTSTSPGNAQALREAELAAGALALKLQYLDVRGSKDIEGAIQTAHKEHAEALMGLGGAVLSSNRTQIIELTAKNRLPTMYWRSDIVAAGGLMSYATIIADLDRRAAAYVDKILKGAKPADLPVEQPKKFELAINLKAAKQIGLTIPPNVLARADRVIK